MYIVKARKDQIEKIVGMSIRAFKTDVNVGGLIDDHPPGFDSIEWHNQMAQEGHLYQAMIGNDLVGAAILFLDEEKKNVYIGRIFIDSIYHGKTIWNEEHRLQGQTDIMLSEEGIKMAEAAAKEYSEIPFDICFVSPLKRAKLTADIILRGRNIPIIEDDRLKEMNLGSLEGQVYVPMRPDSQVKNLFERPREYVPEGSGETLEELYSRTKEFMESKAIPIHKEGKMVLVVGHGALITSIISQYKNQEFNLGRILVENCKLIRLL